MKLSEAIRAGAKIGPQAYGALNRTRRKWLFGLIGPKVKELCAMGAAFEAQGCETRIEESGGTPFRGQPITSKYARVVQEPNEWLPIQWSHISCPQCLKQDYVFRMVPHLNDVHRWSREEIALFVERIESDPSVIQLHDGNGSSESPFRQRLAHGHLDTMGNSILYARLQIAPTLQRAFPGYGHCERCELPWAIIEGHCTNYEQGRGCFPLCEDCWQELQTPENRLPYYMELVDSWDSWENCEPSTRQAVASAVASEGIKDTVLDAEQIW